MSTLGSRYGLQGLERQGVYLADLPGQVAKGKELVFFSLTKKPPAGSDDPLAVLKKKLLPAVEDARRGEGLEDLHLYYLDSEGHAVLSVGRAQFDAPQLIIDNLVVHSAPLNELRIERRYEATGKSGVHFRLNEEIRDVYTALEKFQASYQLGWGGLFFARDKETRTKLFEHFDPVRTGVFRVEERLTHLSFSLQLFQGADSNDVVAYRAVHTSVETATLDEALTWA